MAELRKALAFEPRGIGPIFESRIDISALHLLGKQRRSPEHGSGLSPQIEESNAESVGDEHEPAFVEWTARHSEPLAF